MTDDQNISYALPQEIDLPIRIGIDTVEPETGNVNEMEKPDEVSEETEEITDDSGVALADIGLLLDEATRLLDEVSEIRGSIGDIDVGGKFQGAELSEYRDRKRGWEKKGYNVSSLESVLATEIEELVKRVFESYERDVKRLKEIEKSLNMLDTTGFKKNESDIRDNLRNPERIIPTLKHLIELEINIRRKMEMDV